MPEPTPVPLGRAALTERQLRAAEIALYRAADLINRLMKDGIPYTKIRPDEFAQGGQ